MSEIRTSRTACALDQVNRSAGLVVGNLVCCVGKNIRDVEQVGTIKYVWEISRHQYLSMLAAAYWLTGNEAYAELANAMINAAEEATSAPAGHGDANLTED